MPIDPPSDVLLTLGITFAALTLFLWNRLRVEVVGLLVMTALILVGLVTPQEGLSGFANEATVTVALMLVLSTSLLRTGVIDMISRWTGRLAGESDLRLLTTVVIVSVTVSAFMNNTAVVAVLVPTVMGLSREFGWSPSRLLMPLSFASQMGGTLTLIGTSTNLLVAGLVLDLGLDRIRLFDITPAALIFAAIGVFYLLTVGRRIQPHRIPETGLLQQHELREYLTALVIEPGSRLAERTLAETSFADAYGLEVVEVERVGERIQHPRGSTLLHEGDLLLVQGKIPDIAQIEEVEGLRIAGTPAPPREADEPPAEGDSSAPAPPILAEVMVPPRSHLIGHTLKELGFRARFGVSALAIERHGQAMRDKVGRIRLHAGDMLLVRGPNDALQALHEGRDLSLLGPVNVPARRWRKRRLSLLIMAGVLVPPALDIVPILISALVGVVLMLVTGCVKPDEAYEEMDWSVLVLLASILPLGIAMQRSGAAEILSTGLLRLTGSWGAQGTLAAFYLITVALTAVISNAAAAVVLTPMAVSMGAALGVSPLPFVIAVMFAASNSYLTPIGYQTNLFVYGPGGYRFSDYFRVGAPLTVVNVVAAAFVIPLFFPF